MGSRPTLYYFSRIIKLVSIRLYSTFINFESMIIIWKADYEGSDFPADLKKLGKRHKTIMNKIGGDIYGPYLPQDEGYHGRHLHLRVWTDSGLR